VVISTDKQWVDLRAPKVDMSEAKLTESLRDRLLTLFSLIDENGDGYVDYDVRCR